MFTGQVDVITNRETWLSKFYEPVSDDDGSPIDLTDPLLTVDVVVTIKGLPNRQFGDYGGATSTSCALATASIANGKVSVSDVGFQWQFEVSDLGNLCAGTYGLGVKITINGFVSDVIDGTLAVLQGN